eukprot:643114-Rhodomonas_salina.2
MRTTRGGAKRVPPGRKHTKRSGPHMEREMQQPERGRVPRRGSLLSLERRRTSRLKRRRRSECAGAESEKRLAVAVM